jgi:chromatin modification-related protein EAF6
MADTAPAQTAAPASGAAAPTPSAIAGAANAPADQNAASRGLPYYEKLRRELRDTLQKKRLMDKSMVSRQCRVLAMDATWFLCCI